jgi:anaerobic selenocysteine-containing dehydrogenase
VVELTRADARKLGVRNGQTVTVSSNGTSVELRARIAADVAEGTARIARDHAADLHPRVEVRA